MGVKKYQKVIALMIIIAIFPLLATPLSAAAILQVSGPDWQATGVYLPEGQTSLLCFQGNQPNTVLLTGGNPTGTSSLNYRTGKLIRFSERNLTLCNEDSGLQFNIDNQQQTAWSINSLNDEFPLTFVPSAIPGDGTQQVYGLKDRRLFYSPNGGKNALERGAQFAGRVKSVATTVQDGKVVYIMVKENGDPAQDVAYPEPFNYSLYASKDTGITWEKTYSSSISGYTNYIPMLQMLPGQATPSSWLIMAVRSGSTPTGTRTVYQLSIDGGHTFKELGARGHYDELWFARTNTAVVRLSSRQMSLSRDGGNSWNPVKLPAFVPDNSMDQNSIYMLQARNAPDNLFVMQRVISTYESNGVKGTVYIHYSPDGGSTWQELPSIDLPYFGLDGAVISPYAPTTLLAIKDRQIYKMELPQVEQTLTARVDNNGAAPNYYPETGHNISPLFWRYWVSNGGLAQFGFPRTEAMREFNPEDGKIFTVQYFERARFEYHPEFAGSNYEVLLGLLGKQLTVQRNEVPFERKVGSPDSSEITYFPQTGHYLAFGFKRYWEQNGGLGLYGYPISEEFSEKNPDDGNFYTVQYFERARFEYHPELKNTGYEVLLGLLGNSLLRSKDWLGQ
ncbi:MAG: exo-alpha-sialidase [Chloroflexi bacterium]|uniref:Exo-alpha-sialidase n=1 Tax=Candidatus Chlorohelix allophototropha TaxID=3003348 RepID=A0A8T7M3Z2_9CHLR|nr:exo-alpha-sialidase [Chloroflexota bacterium]WJW70220.1 glycoside hydrolase [Chloroflexota bacterium L227-S17]